MANPPAIVWFRNDLRLSDNPALGAAAKSGAPIVALYVLDDESAGDWRMGAASRWRLHHSLVSLAHDLQQRGVSLTLRRGRAEFAIESLVQEIGACAVYWNRLYEPWAMRRGSEIKSALRARGVEVESFNGALLFEPAHLRTKQGEPFKVFTPFWRACLAEPQPDAPLPAPKSLRAGLNPTSDALGDWRLTPTKPDWAKGWDALWPCGEAAAHRRFKDFLRAGLGVYKTARDYPGYDGVSRLSAALHFGEISPRQIWHAVDRETGASYLRELGWREFCHPSACRQSGHARCRARQKFRGFSVDQ